MSLQHLISFVTAMEQDDAVRDELARTVGDRQGQEAMAATADFATARGYPVTTHDVATGYAALEKVQDDDGEELSDAELEVVAGGKGRPAGGRPGGAADAGERMTGFFNDLFGH